MPCRATAGHITAAASVRHDSQPFERTDMNDITDLRKLAIKAIVPRLPELDDAQLADLQATEAADENPRESLMAAIDAELQRRTAGTVQTKPAAAPAWQAPDYSGPLTGEQASWRHANIKRL